MANEADVRRGLSRDVEYYTVADGTAIAKGTLMCIQGDRTAVAHAALNDCPIGYAVSEKEASDGQTEMGVQVSGLVEAIVSATTYPGDLMKPSATANQIMPAASSTTATISGAMLRSIFAIALDNIATGTRGTVKIIRR